MHSAIDVGAFEGSYIHRRIAVLGGAEVGYELQKNHRRPIEIYICARMPP